MESMIFSLPYAAWNIHAGKYELDNVLILLHSWCILYKAMNFCCASNQSAKPKDVFYLFLEVLIANN